MTDLKPTPLARYFDWEKAKTFYYIAKCGSFAAAARLLNASQPSLSRQIGLLEQQVGCPLFSRHSAGVSLTRKGTELFAIVEKTYSDFTKFTESKHVQGGNGTKTRKIRIATTYAVASYILEDHIHDFNQLHPEIVFELIADDHLVDVVLHDVDIAIRPLDDATQKTQCQNGVQYELLFQLVKKLYASQEYIERYGNPRSVEDLRNHHLIGHSNAEAHPYADVNWILKLGMEDDQLHDPIFLSNAIECTIAAAKRGTGIVASYDEYSIVKRCNLQRILPQVECDPVNVYFIAPEHLKDDQVINNFKKVLKESFPKLAA